MHPSQVFDTYLELVENMSGGSELPWYMNEIVASSTRVAGQSGVSHQALAHLRAGYVFQVDAKIMGLVGQRCRELPLTAKMADFQPPTPCGFMAFEEPLRLPDVTGRVQAVSYVSWGGTRFGVGGHRASVTAAPGNPLVRTDVARPGPGIYDVGGQLIVYWNDHRRAPDDFSRKILDAPDIKHLARRDLGFILPVEVLPVMNIARVGPDVLAPTPEDRHKVEAYGFEAREHPNVLRRVLAVWSLMDESISDHREDTDFKRPARRRADRLRVPRRVTVISLRRRADSEHTGTGRPLDHQIWVRPHRRSYWVGTGAEREKITRNIDGHFRGPKNAPLVVTDKVYRLHR